MPFAIVLSLLGAPYALVEDEVHKNGQPMKLVDFFKETGRPELAEEVEGERTTETIMGVGVGCGGIVGLGLGIAAFGGFTSYAVSSGDPANLAWAVPAGIGSMFGGFCLLFGGLIGAGAVVAHAQLTESWPVPEDERKPLVDAANRRAEAMRY